MENKKTQWWEGLESHDLPKYVKLDGRVYPMEDAISLGKIIQGSEPATKKDYLDYKKWIKGKK